MSPTATRNAPHRWRTARSGVRQQIEHARHHQALGRDVEQVQFAVAQRAFHGIDLAASSVELRKARARRAA